jgi:hypothetical protein
MKRARVGLARGQLSSSEEGTKKKNWRSAELANEKINTGEVEGPCLSSTPRTRRGRVENEVSFLNRPMFNVERSSVAMKGLLFQLSHDDEFITVTGEYRFFEEERPFSLDLVDSAAALENAMRCSSPLGVDVRVGGPQWQWQWASGSIKGSSD